MADSNCNPAPSRVGLFGLFGIGNFGNDASLDAGLAFIRNKLPSAQVTCICTHPEIIEPKTGIESVRINCRPPTGMLAWINRILGDGPREIASILHTLTALRRLDFLIFPGTGVLDDFGTGPFGIPYIIFRWCLAARLLGIKILFLNIGAGPITHPISRFFMKAAAHSASYRSYRDDYSLRYMQSIGVDVKNDVVYPDIAFGLPAPRQRPFHATENDSPIIGIGLMSYTGWRGKSTQHSDIYETYIKKMREFVTYLLDRNYRIRLLSGDESDSFAIHTLLKYINEDDRPIGNSRIIFEPAHSFYDVMTQIADTEVVVATRYHNVIAALMMGKPTLSLSYSAKNDALLSQVQLEDYCQHVEKIDLELLASQFQRLMANRDQYASSIEKQSDVFRQRLHLQQNRLLQDVLSECLAHESDPSAPAFPPSNA